MSKAKKTRRRTQPKNRSTRRRGRTAALRNTLATTPVNRAEPRRDFPANGGAGVFEAMDTAPNLTFVAAVSTEGPWELRSLVINDFQVLHTTVPSTTRRIDVPIPPVLGTPLDITWSIVAAHLILDAGTFIEPEGQPAVLLASKGPLKKGESWAPLLPTRFPKA